MLEAWVNLIQDVNPDYLTGYNIFGFDFDYIISRVIFEYINAWVIVKIQMLLVKGHSHNCKTNKFYRLGKLIK